MNKDINKQRYYILCKAKDIYLHEINRNGARGLCYAITEARIQLHTGYIEIPEFNREFCNADNFDNVWWWNKEYIGKRLDALAKMIKVYEEKTKDN